MAARRSSLVSLLVLAVLAGCVASPASASPRLGLEVGPDCTSFDISGSLLPVEREWMVGYHGTVTARGSLTPHLGLVAGLGYRHLRSGDRMTIDLWVSDGIPPDPDRVAFGRFGVDHDFDQVVLPAALEWRLAPDAGLRFTSGIEAAYLMRARDRGVASDASGPTPYGASRQRPLSATANIFERLDQWREATDAYERLWGSASAGVGYDLPWGGHALSLDARFVQSLHDVLKSGSTTRHLQSVQLSAGVRY